MKSKPENKRRQLLQAGLTLPFMSSLPWQSSFAMADKDKYLAVPYHLLASIESVFGVYAQYIYQSDTLSLKAPDIAENNAVVPVSISGPAGTFTHVAVFAEENINPLCTHCRLTAKTDLSVGTRIKIRRSSTIYAIAETNAGLVGVQAHVKVTIGCGGG